MVDLSPCRRIVIGVLLVLLLGDTSSLIVDHTPELSYSPDQLSFNMASKVHATIRTCPFMIRFREFRKNVKLLLEYTIIWITTHNSFHVTLDRVGLCTGRDDSCRVAIECYSLVGVHYAPSLWLCIEASGGRVKEGLGDLIPVANCCMDDDDDVTARGVHGKRSWSCRCCFLESRRCYTQFILVICNGLCSCYWSLCDLWRRYTMWMGYE